MKSLADEVSKIYEIKVLDVRNFRGMPWIQTANGSMVLKRMNLSEERILFIHEAQEHLYKNGSLNTDRFLCAQDGKPYFIANGYTYILKNFVDGEELSFENSVNTTKAAKKLALMHQYSKGFYYSHEIKGVNTLGKLSDTYGKRISELRKMYKKAYQRRKLFDCLYLEKIDYFLKNAEEAIAILGTSCYKEAVCEFENRGGVSHHDINQHSIILKGDETYITNFDYCCLELKVYDLVNLMRRRMRKCKWSVSEGKKLLEEYVKIEPLDKNDLLILKAMLLFPQKFWRIANKFYNSRAEWSERSYMVTLQETIDEIEPFNNFISCLYK